jgi:mannosyltransferase OCH1-like enzyme
MIPRIIHRVWLGGDPMPDEFEHYGETWRQHHPDWEMRLWTDSNLPELKFPEAFERSRNHGERSDVLRSELLLRFGGLYVDTDVECRRPIEPLIGDAAAFAAWVRPGRIGSAVLGAIPGHPAIERLLTEMQDRVGEGNQIEATVALLTTVLSEAPDVVVFDSETFYPYHPRHNPANGREFPDAYAVHHWGLTWKTRDELRDRVRGLRDKYERAAADNDQLKQRQRRLRKRLAKAEARNEELTAQLARARGTRGGGRSGARAVARAARTRLGRMARPARQRISGR